MNLSVSDTIIALKDAVYHLVARVVKLVDTGDSKSPALKSVPVQVRPPVPLKGILNLQPLERPLKCQIAYKFQEGGDAQTVAPKYSSDF